CGSVTTGEDHNSPGYVDSKSDDGSSTGSVSLSQGGSIYYLPTCDNNMKPSLGMVFRTMDGGVNFYMVYADAYGFVVRFGSLHKEAEVPVLRSLLCYRKGYKIGQTKTKNVRACASFRFGCTSKVAIRLVHGVGYKIVTLEERHTHELCVAIEEREVVMNQLISYFYSCVGLLEDKIDMMKAFSLHMMQKKESLVSECGDGATSSISIQQNLEKYCIVEVPSRCTSFHRNKLRTREAARASLAERKYPWPPVVQAKDVAVDVISMKPTTTAHVLKC
ncbi:hypothetical protein V2J09_016022, partial [Rumex salicifolius]